MKNTSFFIKGRVLYRKTLKSQIIILVSGKSAPTNGAIAPLPEPLSNANLVEYMVAWEEEQLVRLQDVLLAYATIRH